MAARHGTKYRYNDGCRCDVCTAANTAYQQRYRQRPSAVVHLAAQVRSPGGPGAVEVAGRLCQKPLMRRRTRKA
jgi:hypothetical protein